MILERGKKMVQKLKRPMEVIQHTLECNCHRRREWIDIGGQLMSIELSVDDPNQPPMSDEKKDTIAQLINKVIAEKEKEKLAKQKAAEKEKLAKQKAAEKEKEKQAKQKAPEKEK